MIYNQYKLLNTSDFFSHCTHFWNTIVGLFCNYMIKNRLKTSKQIIFIDDVHSHWRFVKSAFSIFFIIDQSMIIDSMNSMLNIDFMLFIQEFAVVKTQKRSIKSIIESFNMKKLMKNINSLILQFDQQTIFQNFFATNVFSKSTTASKRGIYSTKFISVWNNRGSYIKQTFNSCSEKKNYTWNSSK